MNQQMIYGINDRPQFIKALPLALQHMLVAFTGTLSGSLLLASGAKMSLEDTTLVIQCGMFIACIASLIQSFGLGKTGIGPKLPIITSGSYTLVAPMVAMALDPNIGIAVAFGAALVGSIVLFVLAPLAVKYLNKYFTPVVTGSTVLSVGLCLLISGYGYCVDYNPGAENVAIIFGIAMFTFLLAFILDSFTKGMVQMISVLISILAGYILCVALNMVDFSSVTEAGLISLPKPVQFGMKFQIGPILTICFIHIATLMENIGDATNIVSCAENRLPTNEELLGTVRGNGLGSIIAALFNGLPVISGSENGGVIAMSRVASRYVTGLGAILLGILSFFPKFSAILALVPGPVLGGVMLLTLGSVAANGIRVIGMAELTRRNVTILTISLAIGIGGYYADMVGYLPFLSTSIKTIFTGISGTALSALLLNILLPKEKEA